MPVGVAARGGFAAGAVRSGLRLTRVNNNAGAGAARWLSFDGMAANGVHTGHALMGLLGGVPVGGGSVTTAAGLYAAVRLLAALVLLVMIGRRIVVMCAGPGDRARFVGGLLAGLSLCFLLGRKSGG